MADDDDRARGYVPSADSRGMRDRSDDDLVMLTGLGGEVGVQAQAELTRRLKVEVQAVTEKLVLFRSAAQTSAQKMDRYTRRLVMLNAWLTVMLVALTVWKMVD